MSGRRTVPAAVLAVALVAGSVPRGAAALDRFEIQVYTTEIDDPGQLGLELHLNYTARGIRSSEFAGEIPPDRAVRLTLEPSIGVAEWLELGAYLQFLSAPGGVQRFGGAKARAKLVVPERVQRRLGSPLFLGLNVEVSRIPGAIERDPWGTELRPIVGWESGSWLVSFNPIVGFALTGPDRFRPELEPALKVAWNTQRGIALGAEYYAGLGPASDLLPVRDQEQLLFAVVDYARPSATPVTEGRVASGWELNLGLGAGLTSVTGQHLVAKAIVGRSF
ncbi:hypothetical protein [Anaeromyxobacter oryzae]|uniref:Transporter n=1 Tax=Anaeromyxobacter oryzae TaxID=2918170 RepID=A0ABM7WP71_9BACT|nr:hypothetical protein [Anaeromyxobacter oryzae]BDG01265.1 hypothetical protein AMOR_02610 [Anaeromyxobacter oryzae]